MGMREAVTALVAGFLLDQLLGDPPNWPHPVRWIGRLILFLEPVCRRFGSERLRGIVLLVVVAGSVGCLTWGILAVAGWCHPWVHMLVTTVLIYYGVAAGS